MKLPLVVCMCLSASNQNSAEAMATKLLTHDDLMKLLLSDRTGKHCWHSPMTPRPVTFSQLTSPPLMPDPGMNMMHNFQCHCGQLRGEIQTSGTCNRLICYCADCQAFARFVGREDVVLDEQGGTEIVQMAQHRVSITAGHDQLAAVRLGENGLVRWYSTCCNTPLGNTLANPKAGFIGVIHSALDKSAVDRDFGRDMGRVNVDSAIGESRPQAKGMVTMIVRFLTIVASSRLHGRFRNSPFFDAMGKPVVIPKVLTTAERHALSQ